MIIRAIIFIVLLAAFQSNAQYNRQIENVRQQCNRAVSDSDKVVALGKLADYFYIYKLDKQGDSALTEQLRVAELSNNPNLILATYFGVAINDISAWSNTESYNRTIAFMQRGLDYANARYAKDFMAIGYCRLSSILRKKGDLDQSFQNITKALPLLPEVSSDSIKATVYIELGDTYQARGESVPAFTNYNTAFDIAFAKKNIPLQSEVYHHFAALYQGLNDSEAAKQQLFSSVEINKAHNNLEGLARDYYNLGRTTSDTVYIKKSMALSDSMGFPKYSFGSRVVMFTYYMFTVQNSDIALQYFEKEADVKNSYLYSGIGKFNWIMAQTYLYGNKPDSAIAYFHRAEDDLVKNFDTKTKQSFYAELADAYGRKKDDANAIKYYQQSLAFSKEMNNVNEMYRISNTLSSLFEASGNYAQALTYSKEAKTYNDIFQAKKAEKNIALLGVERERKKHEALLEEQENKAKQKRNIQLMAITIVITLVFGFMLVMGMFSVSKLTIKMMGYFAFISLFEFIVLLIDTFLLSFTHGEPLKLWVIKIFLIALLVPFQHFLEHGLIKFLESRKLIEVRTKFSIRNLSIKKWWYSKKPATAPINQTEDIEEDTAVL